MDITISIDTKAQASDKLRSIRTEPKEPSTDSKVRDNLDKKTLEMLGLLRKRLDRQAEPIGGSV